MIGVKATLAPLVRIEIARASVRAGSTREERAIVCARVLPTHHGHARSAASINASLYSARLYSVHTRCVNPDTQAGVSEPIHQHYH